MSDNNNWKKIGKGAAIAGGVILGTALIPMLAGFGTAGVVGGSIAAGIQGIIGNVAAGSVFAVCTSLGMSGVFASSAAVGALLGVGGLAAYIKGMYNPKSDAELILKVIKEKDNSDIIIKLIECRFPRQRNEIKNEYDKIAENGHSFMEDIENYIPLNMREHFNNLMIPTENILPRTEEINALLSNKTFDKYFENEFKENTDAFLINEIIRNDDDPLIIVRLLNSRDEEQRKKINNSFNLLNFAPEHTLLSYIIEFMPHHTEINYIHFLLDNIK